MFVVHHTFQASTLICFSTITNLCIPDAVASSAQVQGSFQAISIPEPRTYTEACEHPRWQQAMDKEI